MEHRKFVGCFGSWSKVLRKNQEGTDRVNYFKKVVGQLAAGEGCKPASKGSGKNGDRKEFIGRRLPP